MEVNQLYGFVLLLILVGMVLGVGVLTLDKFGGVNFNTRTTNYSIVASSINNLSHVALSFGNVSDVTVLNRSLATDTITSCFVVNVTPGTLQYSNFTVDCAELAATGVDVSFTFKDYNTETTAAMRGVVSEVAGIATNWLGLIVTVAILAIILFLVIRSFSGGLTRR